MSNELIIVAVVLLGFGFWMLVLGRRVSHVEQTMIGIKTTMVHLPSKDDVHRIEKSVDGLRIELAAAREADAGLRAAIARVDQALMRK